MKNLIVYELPSNFTADFDGKDFDELKFTPCGKLNSFSIGFIHNVFGSYVEKLSGGVQLVTIRAQKKSPKKSHINHLVEEKIESIYNLTRNKPNKNEVKSIQDDCLADVLSNTFPDSPVDTRILFSDNLIFVETGAYSKGLEFLSLIESVLGEHLPYSPPEIKDVEGKFKQFILADVDDPFKLGSSTKLLTKDGMIASFTKGDLEDKHVEGLVVEGAEVEVLELCFDNIVTFKVKPSLEFSGISFSLELLNEVTEDDEGTTLLQVKSIISMFKTFKIMLEKECCT